VVVLELDLENRKIKLGHKQLTEDPWATFETIFFEGSVHEATIVKMVDKSAILELQYGIEGFVPSKHLQVAEGQPELRQGDRAKFKVIEFNRENRRIVLSHTDAWKQEKEMESAKASEDVKELNKKNEKKKDTLGDNDVLAALKNKLESDKK
jgi:small subunit ribosomal protein S1